ncbi:acyl-CoA thioesterase [Metallumcola ferriviriculae]|uniref:Acyl-CoA thioesterase n=1 Tax=Metallumcola ferriviriculae TaxID=3039180 RepID=A0AAU0US77_9FIRM|nr:acyl-CoA thioesterase [Desulfitibacteraceae bacterium MK1]
MTVELRVRYQETDQMGVVYHTNYLIWCEMARTELLRGTGMTYRAMEEDGIYLPVVEANCRYKFPAVYDDEVIVKASIVRITGVRLDFHYQIIRKEDGSLLAEAATYHAFANEGGSPLNIKKKAPQWWERLQKLEI